MGCCKKPDCSCFDRSIERCGGNPETVKRYLLNFVLGVQHVLAMMGSNVLVPLITGLSPSIAILSAGIALFAFILLHKEKFQHSLEVLSHLFQQCKQIKLNSLKMESL